MIKFEALMHTIQKSIHSAAQAVESEGFKHIDKFFDEVPSSKQKEAHERQDKLNEAHEALRNKDPEKADSLIKELQSGPSASPLAPEESSTYRPKMVAMAFPKQGKDGVVESTIVNVPLITLCPISSPRINEVKFSTDLEVTADDRDELYIAFRPQIKGSGGGGDTSNTHIEISLRGSEPPEGLQKVIEGYEKALRAQIPG